MSARKNIPSCLFSVMGQIQGRMGVSRCNWGFSSLCLLGTGMSMGIIQTYQTSSILYHCSGYRQRVPQITPSLDAAHSNKLTMDTLQNVFM